MSTGVAMATIKCPKCGKEVNIVPIGGGYVAVCCNQLLYSGDKLAQNINKDTI